MPKFNPEISRVFCISFQALAARFLVSTGLLSAEVWSFKARCQPVLASNGADLMGDLAALQQRGVDGRARVQCLAEAVRFELTNGFPLPVFKTGAIDHSATLPGVPARGRRQQRRRV